MSSYPREILRSAQNDSVSTFGFRASNFSPTIVGESRNQPDFVGRTAFSTNIRADLLDYGKNVQPLVEHEAVWSAPQVAAAQVAATVVESPEPPTAPHVHPVPLGDISG